MYRGLLRQMEAKQGRPGVGFLPGRGAGPLRAGLRPKGIAAGGAGQSAIGPGELQHACNGHQETTGIEMVLRFVVHLSVSKRPKVYTEEDTRPVAPGEEVGRIIAALILRETDFWGSSSQWA